MTVDHRERQKCGSFLMEGKRMVKEPRNQDYTEELKRLSNENEKKSSTPKSILEKLKELENAMITVPVEDANE